MKYVLILLLLASCSKSTQLCDAGKVASKLLAAPIALRWSCNPDKLVTFFESKVGPVTCQDPAPQAMVASLASPSIQQLLCPTVISSLTSLGADKIVSDFECSKEKVLLDLSSTSKICDLFK